MSKKTPTAYTSQEEARCTHKRIPEGEPELRKGEGLRKGEIVSCYMQSQWCSECKKSFWVRVEVKE